MSNIRVVTVAMVILVTALFYAASGELSAQAAGTALRGVVSSQAEGNMEGVVVNARRGGANFTVSVVSDAQGRYSFPRTHLDVGTYTVTTRAVGYDLNDPGPVEVAARPSSRARRSRRLRGSVGRKGSPTSTVASRSSAASSKGRLRDTTIAS